MTQESNAANRPADSLEEIAMVSLELGRLLMESGASARFVDEHTERVARGLGADRVDLRAGYASLAITVGIGHEGITRMRKVGPHGVNQRLDYNLRSLAKHAERGELSAHQLRDEIGRLCASTPHYPPWLVALAVGIACAAFGRLLGVDWLGVPPILAASALGQLLRWKLRTLHVNMFIAASLVAFVAAFLAAFGSSHAGSQTVDTAMIASVLLLVPGVPLLNAQNDILEGRPTLGSARAVSVAFTLVFATVGVWLAKTALEGLL